MSTGESARLFASGPAVPKFLDPQASCIIQMRPPVEPEEPMATTNGGLQQLRERVLDAGLCAFCGACSGLCPYLRPFQGRLAVMESCPATSSRCLSFCPRFDFDLDAASHQLHGVDYRGEPLGEVRQVLVARGTDTQVRSRAQYGGTVTTLLRAALEQGTIESAVLTRIQGGTPHGVIASTPEEVLACAGSSYLAAPTLEALNRHQGDGLMGIVGTPCQLQALAAMAASPYAERSNAPRVALRIGLFCTWALSHAFLSRLAQVTSPETVAKTDVPPPPASVFEVYANGSRTTIPLEEVRPFIRPACDLCPDMTAELADISVGSAEGIEGWNTLLVRTEAGARLVEDALARGLLETGPLPQAKYDHLAESAMNKKQRAFRRAAERTGDASDLLFMRVRPEVASRLIQA